MTYYDALRKTRAHIKAHTHDEPNYEENEVDIALWAVETAADYIDLEHTYTLAELRGSWPYSESARFLMVSDGPQAVINDTVSASAAAIARVEDVMRLR